MNRLPTLGQRHVRSIFISDMHLGCKYAQPEALLRFLEAHQAEHVYLVGDFIDGWRLEKNWLWPPVYNEIIRRLLVMSDAGAQLYYTPGNHDDFLRNPFWQRLLNGLSVLRLADEFVHQTQDGRRFLITHGDLFDDVERRAKWLSVIGAFGYDLLCWSNKLVNKLIGWMNLGPWNYSAAAKRRVKCAVRFVSDYENRLVARARQRQCEGVVCGHIHSPTHTERDGVTYFNTGDWVESCTGLLEHEDGEMELIYFAALEERWRQEQVPLRSDTIAHDDELTPVELDLRSDQDSTSMN